MRKIVFAASVFILALSSTQLQAYNYCCYDTPYLISADYAYMRRSDLRSFSIVQNQNGKKMIKSKDLIDKMGWESAFRLGATITGTEEHSFEAQFTYFLPWSASETETGDQNLSVRFDDPFFTNDFFNFDVANAKYKSWLENAELNYWYSLTPRRSDYFSFSWIFGFRFLYLKERFQLDVFQGLDQSTYNIKTLNLLYGPQLGAVFEMNPSSKWTWTFMVKGAGFVNDAENSVLLVDDNSDFVLRDFKKKRWTNSWLLEGYGQLAYHWRKQWSFHFAYQGFVVTGLSLAPEQIDYSSSTSSTIKQHGQIVIDGLYAGIDFTF